MTEKARNLKPAVLVVVLAAIAAAFGVYLKGEGDGKVGPTAAVTTAAPQGAVTKALSTGTMTAFVVKPERKDVPEISFLAENGAATSLAPWKGRVILVNLWATWCAPCREEMPSLARLQSEMGSPDFEVVAIAVDRKGLEASGKFLKEVNATALKLYADPSTEALGKFQAVGLPSSILIDRQGREIGRLAGPAEWDSPEAKALITAATAEK
ncbi:TlpA family protein disulfide reductase [Nordella sp. HKS 07]|uniref:TlpA family protein disulfide reductase n=1 Tax=Nordella sp. HKS 07 TaxID=2712222 RepID=UPI0013E136F0|nr:TlpA disulfide reductase family protein [Nordella sp. HKS 07]QIG48147.1 TlpA family protein disulfide reductase [Nordella sp. HKS 07]